MADETPQTKNLTGDNQRSSSDEVALEMMKFIALTTGYGKPSSVQAGFTGKGKSGAEEYADALLQLFVRCRKTIQAAEKP